MYKNKNKNTKVKISQWTVTKFIQRPEKLKEIYLILLYVFCFIATHVTNSISREIHVKIFQFSKWLKQGGVISSILFIVYIYELTIMFTNSVLGCRISNYLSQITPKYFVDPLGVIQNASIYNAGAFRHSAQYLLCFHLILEDFE